MLQRWFGLDTMIWLHRIFGLNRDGAAHKHTAWLLNRESFQAELERERMRVDRNDGVFSLMVITTPQQNAAAIERLAEVLRGRIRRTDTAGWFDHERVGVILPDTPSQGAYKLASDLSAYYQESARPLFDIYTHPADEHISGGRDEAPAAKDEALVETVSDAAMAGSDRRASSLRTRAVARSVRIDRQSVPRPALFSRPLESLLIAPQPLWKRAIDIFGASLGLVLLAPLLAVVAQLIKRSSPGPIIFAQKREGIGGRIFTMYKFRTMCTDAEALKAQLRKFSEQDGPAFKLTNDPRVTPLGRFLRKTCIDELPQLWNVLRGDMSLVGPRPLPVDESRNCRPWQRRRLAVKPGLTCIWQVEGGIDVTFDEWMRMDLQYAASRHPVGDARLLWKTFTKVLMRRASR